MTIISHNPRHKVILDFLEDMLAAREEQEVMFGRMQNRIYELTQENRDLQKQLDKLKKKKTK